MTYPNPLVSYFLAALFLTAVVGKIRSRRSFERYLRTPFGRWSSRLVIATLLAEAALGVLLIVRPRSSLTRGAAGVAILIFTAYLAIRVILAGDSKCACFGAMNESTERENHKEVRQAWYAVRNGLLLAAAWFVQPRMEAADVKRASLVFLLPGVILGAGLVLSIARDRRRLELKEHPLRSALAPRLQPLLALDWYRESAPGEGGVRATPFVLMQRRSPSSSPELLNGDPAPQLEGS